MQLHGVVHRRGGVVTGVVVGAILTIVGIVMILVSGNASANYDKLVKEGTKTTGTVSEVEYQTKTSSSSSSSSNRRKTTNYEITTVVYEANGSDYQIRDKHKASGTREKVGNTYTVFYEKGNPDNGVIDKGSNTGDKIFGPLLGGIFVVVGLFVGGGSIVRKLRSA